MLDKGTNHENKNVLTYVPVTLVNSQVDPFFDLIQLLQITVRKST